MDSYEVTVDANGRLTLPRAVMRKVGAKPGDRFDIAEIGALAEDTGHRLSLRLLTTDRVQGTSRTPGSAASDGDLSALKLIALRAREDGALTSSAVDPIGDYLLEEDRRSRGP